MIRNTKNSDIARRQLRQAFRDFDTDKSGYIQRHQLAVLLKRLTDTFNVEDPSDDEINDLLKDLDVNGDGRVSQAQFQALVQQVIALIEQQKTMKDQ